MHRAPLVKEKEEDINDPTTTCWYEDDDYHPDTKI
jgi:hypothetical protein